MGKRYSQWTRVYLDPEQGEKPWYVRLTPNFVELESTGFPHGISISGNSFATKEEAENYADILDKFFDNMKLDIITEHFKELQRTA